MLKFPGWGWNLRHSCNQSHSSDNTVWITCWDTQELRILKLKKLRSALIARAVGYESGTVTAMARVTAVAQV